MLKDCGVRNCQTYPERAVKKKKSWLAVLLLPRCISRTQTCQMGTDLNHASYAENTHFITFLTENQITNRPIIDFKALWKVWH